MAALSDSFQVVAIDQRGYNLIDKRRGRSSTDHHASRQRPRGGRATALSHRPRDHVGHDWGGFVAWSFAMRHPELTERLIILNLPHPRGLTRELANNPAQQANSAYARRFQEPDAAKTLTAEALARRVTDPAIRARYEEAFRRSDSSDATTTIKLRARRTRSNAPSSR